MMSCIRLCAYIKQLNEIVDVEEISTKDGWLTYYDSDKQEYIKYTCSDNTDILNSDEVKILRRFDVFDKNLKYLCEGDIVDIHQTVNGEHLFIITYNDFGGIVPVYNSDRNKKYQYNIKELLELYKVDKEIEIVGNIYIEDREENKTINNRKRYLLLDGVWNNYIIDTNKYNLRVENSINLGEVLVFYLKENNKLEWKIPLDDIEKESDNLIDLIDKDRDLVKMEVMNNCYSIMEAKHILDSTLSNGVVVAIYKIDNSGNYILAWEK